MDGASSHTSTYPAAFSWASNDWACRLAGGNRTDIIHTIHKGRRRIYLMIINSDYPGRAICSTVSMVCFRKREAAPINRSADSVV